MSEYASKNKIKILYEHIRGDCLIVMYKSPKKQQQPQQNQNQPLKKM